MKTAFFSTLFSFCCLWLSNCKPTEQQFVMPTLSMTAAGVAITPHALPNAKSKGEMVTLKVQPNQPSANFKAFEEKIPVDKPYLIKGGKSFTYSVVYASAAGPSFTQQLTSLDTVTLDIVVSRIINLGNSSINYCNCSGVPSNLPANGSSNDRSQSWTQGVVHRIKITDPGTGATASFVAYLDTDGVVKYYTRNESSLTCLTQGGFALSTDKKVLNFSATGLNFSFRADQHSNASEWFIINCPTGYSVVVETLTCN